MPAGRESATGHAADALARRRAKALAEHGTDLSLLVDPDGTVRYVGPALEPLFGYHSEDVRGASGWDFIHPDDEPQVRAAWDRVVSTYGGQGSWEIRVRHSDGSWVWIEERVTNLLHDEAVRSVVVNIRDISQTKAAYQALHEREAFYRGILAAAQEGVWVVDDSGHTLYANEAMAEILGAPLQEVCAGTMWDFVDADTETLLRAALRARIAGTSSRYELAFTRRDGSRRVISISAAPLPAGDGSLSAAVGMCIDITEHKRQEQQLRELALHDPLTGLPNRSLLVDRLAQDCERQERSGAALSVLFCNVDRFKLVNDALGHAAGDQLLRDITARLSAVCREGDTLARFGGDEFVVVCPAADAYVGRRIAEALLATFADPFVVDGSNVTLTASIGVASTEQVEADELLRSADRAAHRAKLNGRARIEVHDPAQRRSAAGQLKLVGELRAAIRNDDLALHYQPIVRADGRVFAVEALLRWTHPQLGAVSPAIAVAAAEEHGLATELGEWVLRRACVDVAKLTGADDLHVAVNMSAQHLADDDVVAAVSRALRVSGLAPGRLTLEVTETSLLLDAPVTVPTLHRLKALGVRIALDDFGTGYSSLSYLRDFPVDVIKIDRSFVAGMSANRGDLAIVATLINLAASVDLHVVAEGVETAEQAATIRRLGAAYGQGFLWSPAVPVSELPALLRSHRFSAIPQERPLGRRGRPEPAPVADDNDRARIVAMHRSGASPSTIAAALNSEGRTTRRGGRWHRNTVAQVIAETTFPELGVAHGAG